MLISRHDTPSATTNLFGVRSAAAKEKVSPKLLRSEADALEKKEAKVVFRAATQLAEKEKHAEEVFLNSPPFACLSCNCGALKKVEQAAKTLRNEAALSEREVFKL
jgi:hypothetical protein